MNLARQLDIEEDKEDSRILEGHTQRYIDRVHGDDYQILSYLISDLSDDQCKAIVDIVRLASEGQKIGYLAMATSFKSSLFEMARVLKRKVIEDAHENKIQY